MNIYFPCPRTIGLAEHAVEVDNSFKTMSTSCDSVLDVPPVSAKGLSYALTALQRKSAMSPVYSCHDTFYRRRFLDLYGGPDVFDAVRDLILDAAYWATEEAHFKLILGLVSKYNQMPPDGERECPPLEWLRQEYQKRLQERRPAELHGT